ncbi:MAG TPA: hypothetical protein VMI31_17765, partial [Fimbriimonadaceae bacterium]|nr:hypothetical protein [Fimbriimonadaceae bacterium]
ELRGPMGIANNGWLFGSQLNSTAVSQPAGSILLTEKHGDDIAKWNTANNGNDTGNFSNFAMGGVIGGSHVDGIGWGPQNAPDGTRPAAAYEYGPNGAVSAKYMNLACFVFCDGHAAAKNPASTDPDPVNKPDLNMWDAKR